jgi:hypothetical protein
MLANLRTSGKIKHMALSLMVLGTLAGFSTFAAALTPEETDALKAGDRAFKDLKNFIPSNVLDVIYGHLSIKEGLARMDGQGDSGLTLFDARRLRGD